MGLQQRQTFADLAEKFEQTLMQDAQGLERLGDAYLYFGFAVAAEDAYRSSRGVRKRPEVARKLAFVLIREDRPEEAHVYLKHVLQGRQAEHLHLLRLLVESYQAKGTHHEAIKLISDIKREFPQQRKEPWLRELNELSLENERNSQPIRVAHLPDPNLPLELPRQGTGALPKVVMSVALGLLLILGSAFGMLQGLTSGSTPQAVLLNALDEPYPVEVNGEPQRIKPGAPTRLPLSSGPLTVRLEPPPAWALQRQEETVYDDRIEGSLGRRLGLVSWPLWLFNPDRSALLGLIQADPTDQAVPEVSAPLKLLTGQPYYRLEDVEALLPPSEGAQGPPIPPGLNRSYRWLARVPELPPMDLLALMRLYLPDERISEHLRRRLDLQPQRSELLKALRPLLEPEALKDFLRRRLQDRPLRVGWHAVYQDVARFEQADSNPGFAPGRALVREYDQMVMDEPSDDARAYLLARLLPPDAPQAQRLWERLSRPGSPYPRAVVDLAGRALRRGDFQQAQDLLERLPERAAPMRAQRGLWWKTLWAVGRRGAALIQLEQRRQSLGRLGVLPQWLEPEVVLLVIEGRGDEAPELIDRQMRRWTLALGAERVEPWRRRLRATVSYAVGDMQDYGEQLEAIAPEDPWATCELALSRGQIEAASEAVKALPSGHDRAALGHLLVYIAASEGDPPLFRLAREHLRLAAESLQNGQARDWSVYQARRRVARTLLGGLPPEPGLTDLDLPLTLKPTVLLALSVRWPEQTPRFRELAAKLNFKRGFPQRFLKQYLPQAD
jgi:tetratricopeptide (TPR) repeat protein